MIKSYSAYNFKSFRNEVKIDTIPADNVDILSENITDDLLKGLLFVGPNASGKTNALSLLQILLEIVFDECDISNYMNIFNTGDMGMKYNFVFDKKEVIYNIKYHYKSKSIDEKLTIEGDDIFIRNNMIVNKYSKVRTKEPNLPILKDVMEVECNNGNKTLMALRDFLNNSVIIDIFSRKIGIESNYKNPRIKYDDDMIKEINKFLEFHNFEFTIEKQDSNPFIEGLFFRRKGSKIKMPFEMESIGNKTLLYIFPVIKKMCRNKGLLILDEFGSGMHNELEELLIRYFFLNNKKSQIFMVSHSTNLLTNTLFRPDQIYSVDFIDSCSVVEKFSSENPRSTQSLEKMYLGGVFGGLPKYTKQ